MMNCLQGFIYVIIPAEPIIDYEIQTTYQNGKYTVIGLKDNESYDILLSNENNFDKYKLE